MEASQYSRSCPFCGAPVTLKNGFTLTGYQRYRCTCGKTFSDSPFPKGSSPHGDEPKHRSLITMRSRKKIKEKNMKLARLEEMFKELQTAQNEQGSFGGTTPYLAIIEEILKDSATEFCLAIAQKAIDTGVKKYCASDRPEPVELPVSVKRGRRPQKAQAIYGAIDG